MSDRAKAFLVILGDDFNEDEIQSTIEALKHFRGVVDVQPHIHDISDVIAETRARQKLANSVYRFLTEWK